jgi:hypothetical protein
MLNVLTKTLCVTLITSVIAPAAMASVNEEKYTAYCEVYKYPYRLNHGLTQVSPDLVIEGRELGLSGQHAEWLRALYICPTMTYS